MSTNNLSTTDSEFTVGESLIGEGIINYQSTNNMNTENTPTQTLFRFVSLRSPQLSDDKDLDKKFILIPEELKTDNQFYVPVTTGTESKQSILKERSRLYEQTADYITDVNYLKNGYSVLYNFATWLARNKETCSYEEFTQQKESTSGSLDYMAPDLLVLWNNLIYQVVTQKSFYIKETVMQMLAALHTLQNSTNDEEETSVLLKARIVLPKELMLDEETLPSSQTVLRMADDLPKETYPTEEMKKQQEIASAKMMLDSYEALKKNLSVVEKRYNKEYQDAYKTQEEAYQATIAPAIAEYNETVAAVKADYCELRPADQEYDPNDPCKQPREVPYPVLPKFEFEFRPEISGQSLATTLKSANLETMLDLLGFEFPEEFDIERLTEDDITSVDSLLEGRNTFAEVTSLINESVEKSNNAILENTEGNNEEYTSIGGVILPVSRPASESFTYQLCPQKTGRFNTFILSVNVPDTSWDIAGITLVNKEYGINNQIYTTSFNYFNKSRSGNTIYLSDLLASSTTTGSMLLDIDRDFEFDITFTNGFTSHFVVQGVTVKSCLSGYFEPMRTGTETPIEVDDDEKDFIPSGFGFKNIGIADYLKVEQSTHAYVEGEVANIENVMAREYREKSTRRLRRSENTTTTSSDTEREQLSDTTTANRFEMQTEISKMMQEASDFAVTSNANMQFGKNYTLNLGANYANHKSKEESTRQAVTEAQDVTSRAMDRIVTKVHEERIEKILEEFEENNSHGFDNRKGDKHVVGVYRWVDKLMKNQIYNYGKRMMFEFMIPEPAKLHTLGMVSDKSASQTSLIKPEDPRAAGNMQIANYGDLFDDTKLKYWLSKYNVEIDPKPESNTTLGKGLSFSGADPKALFFNDKDTLTIPDGYAAKKAKAWLSGMENLNNGRGLTASVGDVVFVSFGGLQNGGRYEGQGYTAFTQEFRKSIPIAAYSSSYYTSYINISIYCELTQEAKDAWQQKAFKAIIDAYEEALVEYNNKLEEEQNKAVEIKDSNPNFYRQIENTILRKNCISYMADRNTDSTHGYGMAGLTEGSIFKDYETKLTSKLDKYTAFVKFMEQAFEWDNLSYYLYPFYWGNKQNWMDLYQAENTDPLFRAFLQSGMARVIVTVRPGFEDAVQFYLATGKIWNGGEVPVIGDELYLSLVDEMKEPKGVKQGKAWLTRLPTTLNILQAESIGLKVAHALPFTTENPEDFEVPSEVITEDKFNFEKTDSLLGVQPSSLSDQVISGDWV